MPGVKADVLAKVIEFMNHHKVYLSLLILLGLFYFCHDVAVFSAKHVPPLTGLFAFMLLCFYRFFFASICQQGVEPPIIEKPLRSKNMKDVCRDAWDAEYIDKVGDDRQSLYDLILASNYMDIKSLLHLGCAKVASLIKGQPLEKIKDILSKGTKNESSKPAEQKKE